LTLPRASLTFVAIKKQMLRKIFSRINNKYFYAGFVFGVWILFFDNNSFISQLRLNRTLNNLLQEKEYYLSEIAKDRQAAYELATDTLTLIKFGREQYLMKREHEDIYLIVEDEKK
jgi:cell division protein DivIC